MTNQPKVRGWAPRATDDKLREVGLKPLLIPNRPERWDAVGPCDRYNADRKIAETFGK